MSDYYVFVERNDWEGETWRFYIPVEENEEAIDELVGLLEKYDIADDEVNYWVQEDVLSSNEVEVLCKYSS